ncbi:MAG: hypothetical protein ACI4QX_07465 [Lachnospiraceae bacterium]
MEQTKGKKKVLVLLAAALGGLLFAAAGSFGVMMCTLALFLPGIALDVLLIVAWVAVLLFAQHKLSAKFGIGKAALVVCTAVVPVAAAGIGLGIIWKLEDSGYWAGEWFGGLFETLWNFSAIICSGIVLAALLVWYLAAYLRKKK